MDHNSINGYLVKIKHILCAKPVVSAPTLTVGRLRPTARFGFLVVALSLTGAMWTHQAHAISCASATKKLTSIQSKMVKQRREERKIRNQLEEVRKDFAKAQKQRKKWERSAKRHKCDKKGANAGKCQKAEREVRLWNKEMKNLQREEERWLRKQRKNGFEKALVKEEAAEKVRNASCSGLPAPKRPTLTPEEQAAARLVIGVIGGVIANRAQRGSGGAPATKCHRNPTTGKMHCNSN